MLVRSSRVMPCSKRGRKVSDDCPKRAAAKRRGGADVLVATHAQALDLLNGALVVVAVHRLVGAFGPVALGDGDGADGREEAGGE
jgi:hypothetical protein